MYIEREKGRGSCAQRNQQVVTNVSRFYSVYSAHNVSFTKIDVLMAEYWNNNNLMVYETQYGSDE